MINIDGYKIIKEVYNSKETLIYSAVKEKNKINVLIKIHKSLLPAENDLKKIEDEFFFTSEINLPGVIKYYEIVDYKETKAIIMEDFGGESLDKFIISAPLDTKTFFIIALKTAAALEEIHKKNIIHKDIKPHNIIYNKKTGELKIIDFSISTRIKKEIQQITIPEKIEGSLPYISPEQTGRMNRSIDYRTDLYSLGVSFYQLITGKLPFSEKNPLELIHSHLAVSPTPPFEINPLIPEMLSRIIIKLISKNAEDRYQSFSGLLHDLKKTEKDFLANGFVKTFELGKKDISDKLVIPEKIFGREKEIKKLTESFDKASNSGKEILFFCGEPGIGKSILINEIHKPIIKKNGLFASGKFDQLKREMPYSAIIAAFRDLIKSFLALKEKNSEIIKNEILNALGRNTKVLIDMIPEIELITGQQPEIETLLPQEAQNRLNFTILKFIKIFANNEHPFVLFIDDLQWADNASLDLLKTVITDIELTNFFFIASYRDTQSNDGSYFSDFFKKVNEEKVKFEIIKVNPLPIETITFFLADIFKFTEKYSLPLAKVILEKSGGNPFFMIEFIKTLYSKNLIVFERGWNYNIDEIKKADITDNVVELLKENIIKLPKKTIALLSTASVMGISFDLQKISKITNTDEKSLINNLHKAIDEGFIIKIGKNNFKFIHDKIQETLYGLIDKNEKKKLHCEIGKSLLSDKKNIDDDLFQILNHLNFSKELLNENEKNKLLELNIKAGNKARASSAFNAALTYWKEALYLLPENGWIDKPELALTVYMANAEIEYINTNYTESEKLYDEILENNSDLLIKARVYQNKIISFENRLKFKDAIELALSILKELGVILPEKPEVNAVQIQIERFYKNLGSRSIDNLIDLPIITDQKKAEALGIMMGVFIPVWMLLPDLLPVMTLEIVNISLEYGVSPFSSFGFIMFGVIASTAMGQADFGLALGELTLKLQDKLNFKFLKAMTLFMFSTVHFWKKPAREGIKYFEQAYLEGIENGNLQWASYGINHICMRSLYLGENLSKVYELYSKYEVPLLKLKQNDAPAFFYPPRQTAANLLGKSKDKLKLKGDFWDEDVMVPKLFEIKYYGGLSIHYTFKLMLLYILNDYKNAYETAKMSEPFTEANFGQMQVTIFYFYYALSIAAIFNISKVEERNDLMKKLISIKDKLDLWAKNCPENFLNKALLVSAEIERINKNDASAVGLYDKAIEVSKKNSFVHEEGISNELAARYFFSKDMKKIAFFYIIESAKCYKKWGALAKIEELEKEFPKILEEIYLKEKNSKLDYTTGSSSEIDTSLLDIISIIKSMQSISGEILMENLSKELVNILVENAGAQRGILALVKNNVLFIEAEKSSDVDSASFMKSISMEEYDNISHPIARYSLKTKESVILNDAQKEGIFTNDPYIIKNKVLSLLCLPIISQQKVIGIIYLENNITTNAFQKSRIDTIKILSTQAAIALENAKTIEIQREKDRLNNEMKIAQKIQTSLMPEIPFIDEVELSAYMKPAEEVGGDYYDLITDSFNNLWIAVGDVSGHGLTSGLIMMMAETSFNNKIQDADDNLTPKDVIVSVNKTLCNNVRNRLKENHFMTMVIGKYSGKGRFSYSGSHNDLIVYRSSLKKIELHKTEGLFLSILPDISNKVKEFEISLDINDILFIYTDGITEAKNIENPKELYGIERLSDTIKNNSNKSVLDIQEIVLKEISNWAGNRLSDDVSFVILKRHK